jgi:dihydrofolate reductase
MDNLTPIGKLFFASLIGWINNNNKLNWKLKGSPEEMKIFAKVVLATKRYQEEVKSPDATVDTIMNKLQEKNAAAKEFLDITKKIWPL